MIRLIFSRDTWQEIFGSISKNKVRTVITVIGVLWGIFIYIVLSGAAQGLDNGFERDFKSNAKNSIFIWTERTSVPYDGFKTGRWFSLKMNDVQSIKSKIPSIQYIAPRNVQGLWGGAPPLTKRGTKSGLYAVYGDYPDLIKIQRKKIYDGGRFINESDIKKSRKVCVIGERTRDELFKKDEDPIGEYIRVNDIYFQVIGVHVFSQSGGGFENDSDIFIPFTTFKKIYNTGNNVGWFAIAAYPDVDVIQAEKDVKKLLKKNHRVAPEDNRAIGSFNLGAMFDRIMGFSKGMTFLSLVVGIATIIAGVIGIGNILLISVKERTKELGIRRALGATPGEVKAQIILESLFLTMTAGVAGVILGAFALTGVDAITQDIEFPYTNPTVPIPLVLAALLIMVVLGSLIGLIPAQRAVSIKPIDALREE
ncbi:MAG: ABC transporter permease [Reichenbachiella sp.]